MIYVVDKANRHLYSDQIDQHHKLRYKIYCEGHGWQHLSTDDEREIDQFDTDDTVYLFYIEEDGNLVGGSRLNSSLGPTLTNEVFPHLCSKRGVPTGSTIIDWTRFFVAPERRDGSGISDEAAKLYCSVMEYALQEGASELTFVAYDYWLDRFATVGWHVEPLGLPEPCDGRFIIAGSVAVSEEALENARNVMSVAGSHLQRTGPRHSIIQPPANASTTLKTPTQKTA